jgi:hypothetical protein
VSITVEVVDGLATPTPTGTGTETPEPTGTESPEPTGTETPEPTGTETPEPTETESPEPTETPREGALAGVLNQGANVRAEADENSERVGGLEAGARVEVVGRDSTTTWLQIIFPFGSDDTAWVFGQFINVEGDTDDLPITSTATPTPTPEEGIDFEPIDLSVDGTTNALVLELGNNGPADYDGGQVSVTVTLEAPPEEESSTVTLDVPEIAAGDSVELTIGSVHVDNSRTVEVLIDPSGSVEEENEDNNLLARDLGPAASVDLVLVDFDVIGDDNHIRVSMRNDGDTTLSGVEIVIIVRTRVARLAQDTRTITMEPGDTLTLEILDAQLERDAEVTVEIDAEEAIADSDRDNNVMTKDIDVP